MKTKILIIDNESDSRIFLTTLLKSNGYESIQTASTTDGLKKARSIIPDLIILDLLAPKEGGAQFYCTLRQDKKMKNISVIVMSPVAPKAFFHYPEIWSTATSQRIRAPEAFLEKPPEAEDLLYWVNLLAIPRPNIPDADIVSRQT